MGGCSENPAHRCPSGSKYRATQGQNLLTQVSSLRRRLRLGFPQLPVAGKTHLSNTLVASEGVREFLFLALHPPKTPTTHTKNYPLHLPPATTAPSSTIPTSPTPAPAHTSNGDNPHNSHIPPSHSQTPVPPDNAPPTPIHTPPNALTPEHAPCPERPDANHTPHEPQATSPPPPPATTNQHHRLHMRTYPTYL